MQPLALANDPSDRCKYFEIGLFCVSEYRILRTETHAPHRWPREAPRADPSLEHGVLKLSRVAKACEKKLESEAARQARQIIAKLGGLACVHQHRRLRSRGN